MTTTTETRTATFVRDLSDFTGSAKLYRLDPPLETRDWDDEASGAAEYVVVSATVAPFSGPETYIFAADEAGEISSWTELCGSYKGGLDHEAALNGAGYAVVA